MSAEFNKKLGLVLRERREEKGFSLEYVANVLGVTKTHVSYWEKGKRSMYAEQLRSYCLLLGMSMQEVFDQMDRRDVK